MNSDWSVIWPGDGEDKTIALVKLFAMVTLSLKVTWYALRWLPGKGNAIVPFVTTPPTDTRIAQIFLLKHFSPLHTSWRTCLVAKGNGAGWSVEPESRAGPAAAGRMAPERTRAAQVQVCPHLSGDARKSIKISTSSGTFKTVTPSPYTCVITVKGRQKLGVINM